MACKIQHNKQQLRFPNREAAKQYASRHGGLDRWVIMDVDYHEQQPVVIQPAENRT